MKVMLVKLLSLLLQEKEIVTRHPKLMGQSDIFHTVIIIYNQEKNW